MADGMEKQMEQMQAQMRQLQNLMDQMSQKMEEYRAKGGQAVEEARGRAIQVGQKVSEQKGIAIPFGLLATLGLMVAAVWIFYPDLGARLRSMMQMGPGEAEKH
jgi:hypothetical protein